MRIENWVREIISFIVYSAESFFLPEFLTIKFYLITKRLNNVTTT